MDGVAPNCQSSRSACFRFGCACHLESQLEDFIDHSPVAMLNPYHVISYVRLTFPFIAGFRDAPDSGRRSIRNLYRLVQDHRCSHCLQLLGRSILSSILRKLDSPRSKFTTKTLHLVSSLSFFSL